jgi:hypothetical protein
MTSQRTPRRTVGLGGAATVLAVAALTGCSTTTGTSDINPAEAGQASDDRPGRDGAGAETTPPVPDRRDPSNGNEGTAEESTMQIEIRVGDERFTATVDDTPAGRDLLAQLPQTIQMRDHGGVEKTGPLQTPLSLDGRPDGADPDVGDLGYYAPGNDLVFYYGDQGYYSGIVILGRLDAEATSRLAAIAGDITATVTATDPS